MLISVEKTIFFFNEKVFFMPCSMVQVGMMQDWHIDDDKGKNIISLKLHFMLS